jgi:hypothetical protein
MRVIYKFASTNGLYAFAGDRAGSRLPKRHGPWKSTGNIQPLEEIPHGFDRGAIEAAIDEHGFQMWRIKKKAD